MVVAIQDQPPCERMTNDLHWVEAPAAEENDVVATDRVNEIFADARAMQAQALQRLEQGDVRDAAEKAWCATKRATDALVLARNRRRAGIVQADCAGTTEAPGGRPRGAPV